MPSTMNSLVGRDGDGNEWLIDAEGNPVFDESGQLVAPWSGAQYGENGPMWGDTARLEGGGSTYAGWEDVMHPGSDQVRLPGAKHQFGGMSWKDAGAETQNKYFDWQNSLGLDKGDDSFLGSLMNNEGLMMFVKALSLGAGATSLFGPGGALGGGGGGWVSGYDLPMGGAGAGGGGAAAANFGGGMDMPWDLFTGGGGDFGGAGDFFSGGDNLWGGFGGGTGGVGGADWLSQLGIDAGGGVPMDFTGIDWNSPTGLTDWLSQPNTMGIGTGAGGGSQNFVKELVKKLLGGAGGGAGGMPGGQGGGGGQMPLAGILSGLMSLLGNDGIDPARSNAMWQAGMDTYNRGRDPRNELYDRSRQRVQDSSRAGQSARGITMSPYGAGLETEALKNFDIDWGNNQFDRELSGLRGLVLGGTASFDQANKDRTFQTNENTAGTNALMTGASGLFGGNNDWLSQITPESVSQWWGG